MSKFINSLVSIEDIKYVDYSLYPNPSSDFLTVNASEKLLEIVLYDLSGKQVLQSTANTLDISMLASGVYVAKIKFENGVETTEKIVKK